MQAQHVKVDDDWNYVHNLMYPIANLMEEGRLAEATELVGETEGGARTTGGDVVSWAHRAMGLRGLIRDCRWRCARRIGRKRWNC